MAEVEGLGTSDQNWVLSAILSAAMDHSAEGCRLLDRLYQRIEDECPSGPFGSACVTRTNALTFGVVHLNLKIYDDIVVDNCSICPRLHN